MPSHPVARALLFACNLPIAAPSANLSGHPSPTTSSHVFNDLNTRLPAIIEGGQSLFGLESTVLDCSKYPYTILRPGIVTATALSRICPVRTAKVFKTDNCNTDDDNVPIAPGMKYRHYSPSSPLRTLNNNILMAVALKLCNKGLRVGILIAEKIESKSDLLFIEQCGDRSNLESVANKLYDSLRALDAIVPTLDLILAEEFPEEDIGIAIMNRLDKAVSLKIKHDQENIELIVDEIFNTLRG